MEQPPQEKAAAPDAPVMSPSGGGGGGWFGSVWGAATAAVSQAQSLAKEISGNEEAQRWAEQVKGYGANLQHLSTSSLPSSPSPKLPHILNQLTMCVCVCETGTDIRTRALPTFTSLLSHIAPPISAHERLQIHSTHDIRNYPSLDPLIYSTFSRVMAQVEGGDLLVLQRGSEARSRTTSEPLQGGYRGAVLGSSGSGGGWTDGPWWRDEGGKRDLGAVQGLKEGTRLARVSAESYAKEFFEGRGGVEEAAKKATETLSQSNPVRSSDIFLAIQAVSYDGGGQELFAGGARAAAADDEEEKTEVKEGQVEEAEELMCFAIYLLDPMHTLSFSTLSQPFPRKWASWLDAHSHPTEDAPADSGGLPDSILQIIASGGVDPREWVAEWMEEVLSLGVGVVAQQYVARRMGVGEGGIGRGVKRDAVEVGAGEGARAL